MSDDARPGTEGAGETQPFQPGGLIEAERLMALRTAVLDAAEEVENTPIQRRVQAWDRVKIALHAYTDAVAAEARAALLRDAPRVWVAMDQDASAWFHARPVHYAQDEYDGEWRWVEDQPSGGYYPAPSWLVEALGLTPGTVRRYALVPHPEGEETRKVSDLELDMTQVQQDLRLAEPPDDELMTLLEEVGPGEVVRGPRIPNSAHGFVSPEAMEAEVQLASGGAMLAAAPEGERCGVVRDGWMCSLPHGHTGECRGTTVDAAPDTELTALLGNFYRAAVAFSATPGRVQSDVLVEARAAIHAHVEQLKREAAPDWSAIRRAALMFAQDGDCTALDMRLIEAGAPAAPKSAPAPASGEADDNLEALLTTLQTASERVGALMELRRLYRAATGEVVARGRVTRVDRDAGPGNAATRLTAITVRTRAEPDGVSLGDTVLVLRHDKGAEGAGV